MEENFKLYNGDCLEIMKDIQDKSIDMILCDLPYGTTKCSWDTIIQFDKLWEQYNRIIKDNGCIVLFGTEPFSTHLRFSNIKNYKYDWTWVKNIKTNFVHAKRQPLRQTENISVFYRKQPVYNPQKTSGHTPTQKATNCSNGNLYYESKRNYEGGDTERYPTNIINFDVVDIKKRLHPTQKPVDLCEYFIKTYTNEGMTVLDNCMGSGSTGVACLNTNREFIGIELDEEIFKLGKNRINEHWMNNIEQFNE